jgi:hypothetical protein
LAREIPAPIAPPAFNFKTYREDWDRYVAALRKLARARTSDDLVGEVVRWQRADGYARYMVWDTHPLQLVHLDIGDGYEVEAPLIRGLTLADIRGMVAAAQSLRQLFADHGTNR